MASQSSSQKLVATASTPKKFVTKKKSSKESSSSHSPRPFLRDITQLFSINPLDFDEPIRVMIEFLTNHPIFIPLTEILDPPLPLILLHTAFTRIKINNGVLERKIIGDRIVPIHKPIFLKAISVNEDREGFKVQEPAT